MHKEDKTEALEAWIAHLGGCSCGKQINSHQGSGFSNKETENKLLIQSSLNP